MSKYRSEQLLAYVGGPLLVLFGAYFAYRCVDYAFFVNAPGHIVMSALNALVGSVLGAYGLYVVREGRRSLASNHWRAEHFVV